MNGLGNERRFHCNACGKSSLNPADQAWVACNVRAFQQERFKIWRCSGCRSLHCADSIDTERYYAAYPMKTRRLDYGARAAYRRLVARLKRAGVPRGARILDYGCGSGTLVEFLRQAGYNAEGYDPHVQERSTDTLVAGFYDVVVSVDVLEHEEDPAAGVRRLASLVRPGGWVLLSTPNATGIDLQRADFFALSLHAPYHRHILSPEALRNLADAAGLSMDLFSHRHVTDTPWPLANFALFREYTRRIDNTLDAAFDSPRYDLLWRHPLLVFWGLLGYFFGDDSQMTTLFRRTERNPLASKLTGSGCLQAHVATGRSLNHEVMVL